MRPISLLLLLAACAPASIKLDDPSENIADGACPTFTVTPAQLSWVGAAEGTPSAQTFTVTNACVGEEALTVDLSVDWDPAFLLSSTALSITPTEDLVVTVTFTSPDLDFHAANLVYETNDPRIPSGTISLSAQAGVDADGDGHAAESSGGDDCDDANPSVYPSASETWYDGVDGNCDGADDYDQDADGDAAAGFGNGNDCNDTDAAIHSGAAEIQDAVDNDCDGLTDEDFIAAGDVVISEFMHYPLAVSDTVGEWVEVRNTTTAAIDLRGWTLSSDDGDLVTISSSLVVPAGGQRVLGVSADPGSNGGVAVDYTYDRGELSLSGADNLILSLGATAIFDVEWDNTWFQAAGASLSLDPDHLDATDGRRSTYWCPATSSLSAGDFGTPGANNDNCTSVDEDGDGWTEAEGDCDDADASVYPSADDLWDGLDNDCDGTADNGVAADVAADYVDGTTVNGYLSATGGLGIGDVTGDGTPDLVFGGTYMNTNTGGVYVVDGNDYRALGGPVSDYDIAHVTGETYNYLGSTSARPGDNTGDGIADLAAAGSDQYYQYYGGPAVAIFAGGAAMIDSMDVSDAVTTLSGTGGSYTGGRVDNSLDLDGDGVADLVFADPGHHDGNAYYAGIAYVFSMSGLTGDLDADDADAAIGGSSSSDYLGTGIGGADIDGDGYDDLMLGAQGNDDEESDAGMWYVIEGSASPLGEVDAEDEASQMVHGDAVSIGLGVGQPGLGDFDGDGAIDLAVGSTLGGAESVWVFYDLGAQPSDLGTNDADTEIEGPASSNFGYALTVGDLDGDGDDDLAVGAPELNAFASTYYTWYQYPGTATGAVYFYTGGSFSGRSYDEDDAAASITGETSGDLFGGSLSGTGDIDGDGSDDLLVGAPRNAGGANLKGRAYVMLGR